MYYIIERVISEDIPFDKSIGAFTINNQIFDIVKSIKNEGLERISDFIISDELVLEKDTNPRISSGVKKQFEEIMDVKLNELLLEGS